MAIFRCAGSKRVVDGEPLCTYESSTSWSGQPCPGCGSRFYDIIQLGGTGASSKQQFMTAADMPGAKKEYITTRVPSFDEAIGGGLVRGSMILFAGIEGIGKTTLTLMVCDGIARETGRPVLYASGEENTDALINTAHRVRITNDRVILMGEANDIHDVMARCEEVHPFLTVLDSLQAITLSGDVAGGRGEGEAVLQILNRYCKKHNTCGIAINQMNAGLEMKGGTGHRHAAETLLRFYKFIGKQDGNPETLFGKRVYRELDCDEEGDPIHVRTLWTGKNRNGEADKKVFFLMTKDGQLEPLKVKPPKSPLQLVGKNDDSDED